jgi:hypothetical protein
MNIAKKFALVSILALFAAPALSAADPLRFINLSTLLEIPRNKGIVLGVVVGNNNGSADNPAPMRLLVRAVGPSLKQFGSAGAPQVTLTVSGGRLVSTLREDRAALAAAATATGAFPLVEASEDDAAIVETSGGAITVEAKAGAVGGDVLIEVYQIPAGK